MTDSLLRKGMPNMTIKLFLLKFKWLPAAMFNTFAMKVRRVRKGENLTTYGTLFIRGRGKISIGKNVTITSCREMNPIGGDVKTILFAKKNGEISIGDGTGISNAAIIAEESVKIGNNVLIGGGCKLYDNDFHSLDYAQRFMKPDIGVKHAPITVKDGAFIGAHSIILKGVTIGERSIVGAGSVVTKSIPDGEIWAGNPARFIRKCDNTSSNFN